MKENSKWPPTFFGKNKNIISLLIDCPKMEQGLTLTRPRTIMTFLISSISRLSHCHSE